MLYQRILFLCSGNYYRSRFAEELFNHQAKAEATCWRAISRGLALDRGTENVGPLSHLTLQALADRQITPLERLPLACSLEDLESAAMVVAMKEAEHRLLLRERFPAWENRVSYWRVHDIDAGEASDAITSMDRLVTELLASCRSGQR
ncbi:MAG: low molecular weight phosphatase family protein [Bradyrhizobium sp.]